MTNSEIKEIEALYLSSFPEDERREFSQIIQKIERDECCIKSISSGDEIVAFLVFYELNNWIYLEYFAVSSKFRGKGEGSNILESFVKNCTKPIVLEVEPPRCGELARRRIGFYERLNFHLNLYPYQQPAYSKEQNAVDLMLMTYDRALDLNRFEELAKEIYQSVYNIY